MEIAILRYGNFKRSFGLDRNAWHGFNNWENNNEVVNYLATSVLAGDTEKLTITSKQHISKISEYFLKKEQWKK
jgi:recombinational DNA repair protein RecT